MQAVQGFQSTPPRGGRHGDFGGGTEAALFQSTPPRGGRPRAGDGDQRQRGISIHAPREGGDASSKGCHQQGPNFNPRPPRGGRPDTSSRCVGSNRFQSTPPARGATLAICDYALNETISIHAPREGGDDDEGNLHDETYRISIHAPREGGDYLKQKYGIRKVQFQSTPPARGATQGRSNSLTNHKYFNPRPPRGGRLEHVIAEDCEPIISIHAPREGGDLALWQYLYAPKHFNPRPPRGGRPALRLLVIVVPLFQSTPPARGATALICQPLSRQADFNPRPPRGGRRSVMEYRDER